MNSIQKTAKITAVLILIMAVIAPFSMIYLPATLMVPGDAATTPNQITASEGLPRLGIVSDAIVFLKGSTLNSGKTGRLQRLNCIHAE